MTIKITNKELEGANYLDVTNCPLARAVKNITTEKVSVGGYYVRIGGKKYIFDTKIWNDTIMHRLQQDVLDGHEITYFLSLEEK